jgi:hypothetical protein
MHQGHPDLAFCIRNGFTAGLVSQPVLWGAQAAERSICDESQENQQHGVQRDRRQPSENRSL